MLKASYINNQNIQNPVRKLFSLLKNMTECKNYYSVIQVKNTKHFQVPISTFLCLIGYFRTVGSTKNTLDFTHFWHFIELTTYIILYMLVVALT